MRICPVCKAEVSDFASSCEYCGTEIPLAAEYAAILQNAEFVLSKSENILTEKKLKSRKITDALKSITATEETLFNFEESEKIKKILANLKKQKSILEEKLIPLQKKEHRKKIVLTIILSIIVEIALFIIFALVSIFGKESVEIFIYGILGIFFILVGIVLSENIWVGIIGEALAAGLLGALFVWLVSSAIGQIVLILIWTVCLIVFDVITLRKKD